MRKTSRTNGGTQFVSSAILPWVRAMPKSLLGNDFRTEDTRTGRSVCPGPGTVRAPTVIRAPAAPGGRACFTQVARVLPIHRLGLTIGISKDKR
ncbi:hypothetical protein GCM10022222_67490 [Amycolatopsis ultiminotia]|uniref:Uncharacterized protein n=1 Tax=Amycolatopsis ultiminotia TaxID=543629 RepID=A0ABP6XYB2_9PSEU